MIILHFHLQPQFIYELFHINFTSILRSVKLLSNKREKVTHVVRLAYQVSHEVESHLISFNIFKKHIRPIYINLFLADLSPVLKQERAQVKIVITIIVIV